MKTTLAITAFLACTAPIVSAAAQPPASVAGKTVVVLMNNVEMATSELYGEPDARHWYEFHFDVPLLLRFTASGGNSYTAPHPDSSAETAYPDITVSYSAAAGINESYIKVENKNFQALVVLTFNSPAGGPAYIYWHEDGETRHMRNATFMLRDERPNDPAIQLPAAPQPDGEPGLLDDGLSDILAEIESRQCHTASERLYCKRLRVILPEVMAQRNPDYTTRELKGNTALHYACSLSHVGLVQWLVDHGADLEIVNDRNVTVDDCISGPHAATIRGILRKARSRK